MTPILVGSTNKKKVYDGSTALKKLYLGADLIWQGLTSSDFDLATGPTPRTHGNRRGTGRISGWWMIADDKIYTRTTRTARYQSTQDFNLTWRPTAAQGHHVGRDVFSGGGFHIDNERYTRTTRTARYQSTQDFDLATANIECRIAASPGTGRIFG